ncbi:MAG TPA: murein biosynthesis integral membrane protein MurJ, partial [Chthonomonadales bacterium]|nr:murein biosynthesis integral membrane protein MurJ [Chthonomonadales bacterium]
TDVYNGSFTIPDLIFFLIAGGAFSSAFIPVFSEYIEKQREEDAWRIFSVVATIMGVVVALFICLGEIYAHRLVLLTNPGFREIPGKVEATVRLTRILLPAQICFFLGGLMMGTLQVKHRFLPVALGPVIYNLGIILGALFLAPRLGVAGLCWGAVAGAVIGNFALQWIMVKRCGGRYIRGCLRSYWNHPGVKQVGKLMLPVILGLALPQVSTIIGKMFASQLGNGPQSALMNANKLMQVPLGVFATATAQAIFPTMAAQAARLEIGALRSTINYGLRSILFLTIPSSVMLFVLALPVVQLLLQTGKFSAEDARMAAAALRFFSVGLFAWSGHSIITRGFYALKDSRTPVIVGTLVTAIFIPLNALVLRVMGTSPNHHEAATAGLALVTSIAAAIHMTTMLILLRLRLKGIHAARLFISVTKILLAAAAGAITCKLLRDFLENWFASMGNVHVTAHALVTVVACLAAGGGVYAALTLAMKMDEASILRSVWRKLSPARLFA